MKKVFAIASALLALSVMVALGADVDGKWTRETQGKNGPQVQTLTLKSAGGKLTGTMERGGGKGAPAEITDGTIEGANVSFKITQNFGGNENVQTYKGTVSATELKLTIDGAGKGGPQEAVFKKQ
ncbi:MAG: hypothetical protein ABIR70_20315 [Bryobacteraceae bacterium]